MCAAVNVHSHMFEYICMSMYAWIHIHTYMWPLEDDNRYLHYSISIVCVEAGYHADPGAHRFAFVLLYLRILGTSFLRNGMYSMCVLCGSEN